MYVCMWLSSFSRGGSAGRKNSGLVVSPEEDLQEERMCGLLDIGGHIMKIPVIGFQILLCMCLEVCIFELW